MGRNAKLSRDDWIDAASEWIATHGLPTLAVEPLARELGVTKGGFYWCFANRDELVQAVLERWEAEDTQAVIRLVEQVPDSRRQAVELIGIVARSVTGLGAGASRAVRLQYALWCAAADPQVAPVVERVTAARVGYLRQVLVSAGLDEALAAERATLGYASYVGLVLLRATQQASDAGALRLDDLAEGFADMVLAPRPASRARRAGR